MRYGPNPDAVYPNEAIKQVCFIKNTITRPNIIVGEYSYYDDVNGAEKFEEHVTHHYEFIGDKLIIGKFCAIAKGVEFIMNGANHRMKSVTTYPFNIMAAVGKNVRLLCMICRIKAIPLLKMMSGSDNMSRSCRGSILATARLSVQTQSSQKIFLPIMLQAEILVES